MSYSGGKGYADRDSGGQSFGQQPDASWDEQDLLDLTGATTDFDSTDSNQFKGTLSIATTELQIPSNIEAGQYWAMDITQSAGGGLALTFVASYDWGDTGAPDYTTLPVSETATIYCHVRSDGVTIDSTCSLAPLIGVGTDEHMALYDGTAKIKASPLAVLVGDLGAQLHRRKFQVQITGVADADIVTAEVTVDLYNAEVIATDSPNKTTPTGGTTFDIDATGKELTIKGMTTVAVDGQVFAVHNDIAGAQVYGAHVEIAAGKLVLHFHNAGTGADLTLTSIGVGSLLTLDVEYYTSD